MKYENEDLKLEEGLKKDWIITNGIGGYSSSSIIGANTSKYHGLLVAPLNSPGNRHLILSKVDESFESGGKSYNLYTNIGKNLFAWIMEKTQFVCFTILKIMKKEQN